MKTLIAFIALLIAGLVPIDYLTDRSVPATAGWVDFSHAKDKDKDEKEEKEDKDDKDKKKDKDKDDKDPKDPPTVPENSSILIYGAGAIALLGLSLWMSRRKKDNPT